MSTTVAQLAVFAPAAPARSRPASTLLTLARRRAMLTSRTPRQIAVPLLGPALLESKLLALLHDPARSSLSAL